MSVPENMYIKARAPVTWPQGVRVRDYVFNNRGGNSSVSMDNFLSKRSAHAPMKNLTAPTIPETTIATDTTDLIDILEEEVQPAQMIDQTLV